MKTNDATVFVLKMSDNKKDLAVNQISNDTLLNVISSLNEIALGSKINGAVDGGCIIATIRDENEDEVAALLPKDKECYSAKLDTKGV